MTSRFAIAKQHVIDALDELVPELFGSGRKNAVKGAGAWYVPRPNSGSTPDQMAIWRTGARRGGWKDYSTGVSGDAVDLFAYVKEGIITPDSRMRALGAIEERFGIRTMSAEARAAMEEAGKRRKARDEAAAADSRHSAQERSRKAFFASRPEILGTPVETYLAGRGIALGAVPNLTHAFRFRPDAEWWMGAVRDGEGRKIGPGPKFPALVSAMTSADGTICALHYTFLARDGAGKAPVDKPKLMWPDVAGMVIRVTYGPSGLNCEDAAAKGIAGILGYTEGIEDAMSAGMALPALRLHAAGSLAGLLYVPDQPSANAYLVFKDNDWGKPQAAKLFDRAIARLKGFGKPVEIVSMPADWGKDVNDALNA